jgi:sugar lactone lactonase YvrE
VAEHLARRVLAYELEADGALGRWRVFADLATLLGDDPPADPLWGPDGLALGPEGRLAVAVYGGGRVLLFGPAGDLLGEIPVPYPYVTNVAWDPAGERLFVTAAADTAAPPYPGALFVVPVAPIHAPR